MVKRFRGLRPALAASLLAVACMQPAEPTPVSSLVFIVPSTTAAAIFRGQSLSMVLHVDVKGQRTMFLSDAWGLEKLVDQKWKLAYSNPGNPNSQVVTPSHGATLTAQVIFNSTQSPLFNNPQGIYRVHLQMTYADGAREVVPPNETYSPAFAAININSQ